MTSSMIAGEKKWASARRSGMTVLGKVAVPKPLNLPSQKLENHGLDPNVEIVPKGTIGWGSQSSSVPNAWGSSASPNADGSSPRHLSGRPSSGGSTRPSTAGSARTQDNNSKVWGPNSRPSSASGDLTSNQTALTSLRPHSAETRPGSSQLSRFAEPPFDTSLTRGPHVASTNQVVTPSNNDKFSLSSGDFPTLGSEKDCSGRNIESQVSIPEHGYDGRPGSSSSKSAAGKEKNIISVGNVQSQTTWAKDGPQHPEHGVRPTSERWHGDVPPGANPHRPPQHFDNWHGPPMNHPAGWYRGPPGGPPYGASLHPGGFPMEPFPFYHPQRPPNDSYPGLRGTAPRGYHPKNGDLGRPHGPEGFPHPRMLLNPGFYPAPVPHEGFYGPPMGYRNPNERDMPFVGPPSVYKRHPYDNAMDPHSRSPVHGSRGKPSTPELMESRSNQSGHNRGPYKVLLKHTNEWDEKRADEERNHGVPSNIPSMEKKDQRLQKNEWGLEDNQGSFPLDTAVVPESRGKVNTVDSFGNKLKNVSSFRQASQVPSANPESSNLIQRMDDLNAKARNLDGRPEVTTRQRSGDRFNRSYPSGTNTSRRPSYEAQGRVDHRGKKLNNQDVDGWREKSIVVESSAGVSFTNSGIASDVLICDHHDVSAESGKSELSLQRKDDVDYPTAMLDESDNIAQRAKMREIAKQRAEKLQKEEEERIREQKVKAMAKLEELNRRAHIAVSSQQKSEKAPPSNTAQQKEEKSRKSVEPNTDPMKSETSRSTVVVNSKDQISSSNSIMVGANTVVFDGALLVRPNNLHPKTEVANFEAASQVGNGSAPKHKQIEYKQKQSLNSVKGVTENSGTSCQTGTPNINSAIDAAHSGKISVGIGLVGEPSQVTSSNVMTESSTHHKRKINKSNKNKYRADDVVPTAVAPSTVVKETSTAKVFVQKPELDINLLQPKANVAKHFSHDVEQHPSLHGEGTTSGKGSHQWKPQQPRRTPRNQLGNIKMGEREKSHDNDTVAWAPVQSEHKIKPRDRSDIETKPGSDATNAKLENVVQNNMKTKRAEMERYIPKPVAKELAQQGSIQQQAVYQNKEATQHGTSTKAILDPGAESKNGVSNQNKPLRARGAWKQRGSESVSGLQDAGKNVEKPTEQDQPSVSSKEKTRDGWNINDNLVTSASDTAVTNMSGQGVPACGKRHSNKGHRNMENNFDLDHGNTNKTSLESDVTSDTNQIDKKSGLKENRFGGEQQTSQWQPKTQVYSAHNHRNRTSEGLMEAPQFKTDVDHTHPERVNVVHQNFERERMPASSFRGRSHSPNLSAGNVAVSESGYVKNNQHFSSGFRRNGNYNNRNGRGHESRGDGSFNRERPRQNPHFEYQPVGQYRNKTSNIEGSTEGYQNMESRYRERNQGQPRRGGGNFNGRQGAPVHGDSCFD